MRLALVLHRAAASCALAVLPVLASCSDPLSPDEILGYYEAIHIPEPDGTLRILAPRIVAMSLTIDATQITQRIYYAPADPGDMEVPEVTLTMTYEIDGSRLVTQAAACPIEMLCASALVDAPDFLRIGDGVMEVGKGSRGISYRRLMMFQPGAE